MLRQIVQRPFRISLREAIDPVIEFLGKDVPKMIGERGAVLLGSRGRPTFARMATCDVLKLGEIKASP